MTTHNEAHPLAGETVVLASGYFAGQSYWVEDWWDRIAGRSWTGCNGNPACLEYAVRSGTVDGDPVDDEVVYGKIDGLGKLIHIRHLPEGEQANG